MSAPKYSFLRINSNGEVPQEFCNIGDYESGELYENLRPLFSHYEEDGDKIFIGTSKYTFWCNDGKRYKVEVFFDEDGSHKKLLPNHRANAMADAGRFTNKNYNYIPKNNKNHNHNLKLAWGSNYFLGDIICKFTTGKAFPDCSMFENPLQFIFTRKQPNTRMINLYGGEEEANKVIHPFARKDFMNNDRWVIRDYWLFPNNIHNEEYIELMKGWGFNPPPKCVLCNNECDCPYGHSPAPVKTTGRCCDNCNKTIVIPARIKAIKEQKEEE